MHKSQVGETSWSRCTPVGKTSQARFFLLCGFLLTLTFAMSGATPSGTEKPKQIERRGTIVCLAEEMHAHYQAELSGNHAHLYGIKTVGGTSGPDTRTSEYYTLLRTSLSEALFVDNRLHEKELIITGRVFPKTQLLEVIRFASIRDGVVHEIYYYCDTCHIRTVAPGNCACCQAPVVLIEKPKQL